MAYTIRSRDLAGNANQAKIFDTDIRILTDGLAGVGVVSGCDVTAQGSPDMTVAIAAGTIRIASGALVTVASGNGTIGAADATNPRIDLISASNAGVKTVTAGTAAASPKPPDLPAGNVALAMVYVAANDTAISTGEITDKRVVLYDPVGKLLGIHQYAPSAQTVYSITGTSLADVDATNMIVTFTAPASGNVLVRLSAWADETSGGEFYWGLREASSDLSGSVTRIMRSTVPEGYVSIPIYLSGLSAGSHTYKWSAAVSAGTSRIIIQDGTAVAKWGPAIMDVWSAP